MFEKIIEQERLKKILSGSIRQRKVGHAYLFCGEKGMGKMLLAQSFAAALLCTAPIEERPCGECANCLAQADGLMKDYIHIGLLPGERSIKIKQIRELKSVTAEKTFDENVRICLITDADKMTTEAQNALLKTLEEPYPGNVFLLTAENKESILPTIRSRCQVFQLDLISDDGMAQALSDHGFVLNAAQQENIIAESNGNIGRMLAKLTDDADEKIKNGALTLIYDIINGKIEGIFDFSEKIGKQKQESADLVQQLILFFEAILKAHSLGTMKKEVWLNRMVPLLTADQTAEIAEVLFQFSDAMQYNINLRLSWESTLLKIYQITEKTV